MVTMDPTSPFAALNQAHATMVPRQVHVNFCTVCHYVWKAPSAAAQCINCTNQGTAVSLTHYETEAQVM